MDFLLEKHGFYIRKNILTSEDIESIDYIDKFEEYPYSVIQDSKYSNVKIGFEDKIITEARRYRFKDYKVIMKKVFHKPAFIGAHEPYHQDFFYKQHHGYDSDSFIQCFVALDDLDKAPLTVFCGSHLLGVQPHVPVLERDGKAKYVVAPDILEKYSIHMLTIDWLKKGDAIFFDYNLIHGSASNASDKKQKRMIVEMCDKEIKTMNHGEDRRKFEKSVLQSMLKEK